MSIMLLYWHLSIIILWKSIIHTSGTIQKKAREYDIYEYRFLTFGIPEILEMIIYALADKQTMVIDKIWGANNLWRRDI